MVTKRRIGSLAAAFAVFLAFPALASAHLLSVSAGPSHCVSPLSGQYTATVTVTETYFGGTTEDIPVGQNVHELSTSTDKSNSGLNQNYFTQGAVGAQPTGSINLGQPTSFTSPSSGAVATQQFTVTTSVPETYVLGNGHMSSPSTATITAPSGGCNPPAPTCPTGQSLIAGKCVPPTSCPAGQTLSGGQCVPPTNCPTGQTLIAGKCVPPSNCPSGETLSGGQCVPPTTCLAGETLSAGQCVPPTACPAGETLSGGQCVPPTTCPSGETMSGGACAEPALATAPPVVPGVCRASTAGYRVRAGQEDTIVVSVRRRGAAVAGAKVRIALRGARTLVKITGKNGKATFTIMPAQPGTIYVRSASCGETVKVKVFAAKSATAVRAPSFTG